VFARAFDEACELLEAEFAASEAAEVVGGLAGGLSLRQIIAGEPGAADLLDQTVFAQAGLFAVETALYRLLESLGVRPDYVAGHSLGEITAAHVAGVLDLADACRLVAARGRLMQALPAGGAMAAIGCGEAEIAPVVAERDEVSVAAINAPGAVVVSGTPDQVDQILTWAGERGHRTRRLRVSHAFHSPLMRPMLDDFAAVAETITFHQPAIPLVSNLTGRLAGAEITQADYWVRHVREPVRFADAVAALSEHEVGCFVEAGPDAQLAPMIEQVLAHQEGDDGAEAGVVAALLRRDREETAQLVAGLGRAWTGGAAVDWTSWPAGARTRHLDLPTYPFQRRHYWLYPPGRPDSGESGVTDRPSVFEVAWRLAPEQASPEAAAVGDVLVIDQTGGTDGAEGTGDSADRARHALRTVLAGLQGWLTGADARPAVVITRGAVTVADGEAPDPAQAAVWGLVRSAQAEEPGRITLVDLDPDDAAPAALDPDEPSAGAVPDEDLPEGVRAALACGEPEVAVRGGRVWVPR
ncbi:acyltransferase domain-containing protein, partial [Bailinhaonella thermotolerans]|uniref:acyltransferase domain-containing protein n=1 Tax=Bailinhaonella thermotolerans TaxID=1070861 RepID=UPI00192A61C4